VVNLSQGSLIGTHDEFDQLEREIAARFLQDSEKVLVTSAGNTGNQRQHASVPVPHTGIVDVIIAVPKYGAPYVLADLRYGLADQCDVEIVDPTGSSSAVINGSSATRGLLGSQWTVVGTPKLWARKR
jgi:hypothetical protein